MTGLKGIGGQAILPFLETPGTKVQIMMAMYVGDSCLQVWGLTGSYTFLKMFLFFINFFIIILHNCKDTHIALI